MEWERGDYRLSDDAERLDCAAIHALLQNAYWSRDRPRALIEQSIQHSLCFGLFHAQQQVGFARVVTDRTTFAWICDVIIHPDHRGRGLGKWMLQSLLAHPYLQTASHYLRTEDAHGLYERCGFQRVEALRRSATVAV